MIDRFRSQRCLNPILINTFKSPAKYLFKKSRHCQAFEISVQQTWSRLRNQHRKPIRIDSRSFRFQFEPIRVEISKSRIISISILGFIYACFQRNRKDDYKNDYLKIQPVKIDIELHRIEKFRYYQFEIKIKVTNFKNRFCENRFRYQN
jgi:hypothetical protein